MPVTSAMFFPFGLSHLPWFSHVEDMSYQVGEASGQEMEGSLWSTAPKEWNPASALWVSMGAQPPSGEPSNETTAAIMTSADRRLRDNKCCFKPLSSWIVHYIAIMNTGPYVADSLKENNVPVLLTEPLHRTTMRSYCFFLHQLECWT